MDFAFNASALGAGAVIERGPNNITTTSVGSVVLAPTGGEGRTVISNYFSQELVIAHAETKVAGRGFIEDPCGKAEQRFTTWTSVVMQGVSIFGRVSVGEMGALMTSTRGFEDEDDHPFKIKIWFRDVEIDGRKLRINVDRALEAMERYEELHGVVSAETVTSLARRCEAEPERLRKVIGGRKPVRLALVESIEGWEDKTLATVDVRGLGTFRFGELMLKPGQRRINLIRATFGKRRSRRSEDDRHEDDRHEGVQQHQMRMSEGPDIPWGPTGGTMTLGSGEGNGTPIEP
jgi:hypothetical protein